MPDNTQSPPVADEKISKFVAAITWEAEQKRQDIERETQEYIKTELEKAEMQVMQESYELIQNRAAAIREEAQRELSRHTIAGRQALFARRTAIADEVFAAAAARLEAFTNGADYPVFLTASAKAAAAVLGEGVTFELRPADMRHEAAITAAVPGCIVKADPAIALGGLRAASADASLAADDTLDARLAAQRGWFAAHAGLTIQNA